MLDFALAREWFFSRLKTPITWVYVTVGLALSAAAGAFLQSYFLTGFEKAAGLSTSLVEEWSCQRRMASVKARLRDDQFTVLVSPLQGDLKGTQTAKIFVALGGQGGVRLLQVCQSLQIRVGNDYLAEQIEAVRRGRDFLKEWHADLILFGKVAADNSLHIWTINEHGGCDFSAKPVVLTNGALPGEFERDTKTKLLGAVLREIAAACHHGDDMDWDLFKRQMRKLTALMSSSTLDLQEEEQLEFSTSYYNGLNLLYHHYGDLEWFEAAKAFAEFEVGSKGTELRKVNALYFYGRALVSKGDKTNDKDTLNLSIRIFDQILPASPAPEWRTDVLLMRSDAHSFKGDNERAIRDLDEAIRLMPESASEQRIKVLKARYRAHNKKGDVGLAIQDLDEVIRLSPKDPDLLNSRCYDLAKIDRLELALVDCNESLNLRPNNADTLDSRGFTYLKLKRPESAINDYDAALRLNPKYAAALYGRGLAYLMLGNADQGNRDVAAAKAVKADIADQLARYGVK